MLALRARAQVVETPLDEIAASDIDLFTEGGCHILAREIETISGWPIHCFSAGAGDRLPRYHAFVVPAPGWRLDVEGCSPAHMHEQRWGFWNGCEHKRFPYEQIAHSWGPVLAPTSEAWALTRSRALAPLLVELACDMMSGDESPDLG